MRIKNLSWRTIFAWRHLRFSWLLCQLGMFHSRYRVVFQNVHQDHD